jgi:hypothetical protein
LADEEDDPWVPDPSRYAFQPLLFGKFGEFWRMNKTFFQIRSKKRYEKWTEDNELYFAWHNQTLIEDKQPFKQFWEGIHVNFNQRTSRDGRSLSSIRSRWSTLVMRYNWRRRFEEEDD